MKNTEHVTPDQQIQNQKETIQSLERKVESLERELQKHLDPDSGEITPQWKPTGQQSKALESQNGEDHLPPLSDDPSFQKFLDMQIEDPKETTQLGLIKDKNRNLETRIYYGINYLFLPTKVWDEHDKASRDHSVPWWYFRTFLFDVDLFDKHWSLPEFRKGVDMLNDIILAVDSDTHPATMEHLERFELGNRLFGFHDDRSQLLYQATQSLISALLLIRENQDHPEIKDMVHEDDLNDMLVILNTISFYQRLWMEAAEPEEKEDQE